MSTSVDCCVTPGDSLMEVGEAIDLLLSKAEHTKEIEEINITSAMNRVLAEPVTSNVDVPPMDNSAMDGYAINTKDLAANKKLKISQRIPAGIQSQPLESGTAARIFTGASVPEGADAVVMQEYCQERDGHVVVNTEVKHGDHIRPRADDVKQGQTVLEAGIRLHAQHLGMAASVGAESLKVYGRLRVAMFCTGDELVEPGKPLGPGQIYNSNRYTLAGLLQNLHVDIIDLGVVPDDLEKTRKILKKAASKADIIISAGGVSVGEEDYVKLALEELGELNLWRVKMKPGKPVAFGSLEGKPFIGLPGNPVAVFVTFCLFARPFLLRCQGVDNVLPKRFTAIADFDWPKAGKRREYVRAKSIRDGDLTKVALFPKQGSAIMTSTVWANGFVEIMENTTINRGEPVSFIPFSEFNQ